MRQSAERGLLMRLLQVVQPEHKGELGWFRRTFTSKYLGGRDARDVRC
jgi:hypothetical protein